MPLQFMLPASINLSRAEQEMLPSLTQDDPIFSILPIEKSDVDVIAFEQLDDYQGLQTLRGLNGQPGNVTRVGIKRYEIKPGVYGEYTSLNEADILKRRKSGTLGVPVDLRDLVADQQRFLLHRRLMRIRQIGWTLLASGTFSVSSPNGNVVHTDSFNAQTFNAALPWSNLFLSTPLADIQACALKARGYSVAFDENDKIYCNRRTANSLVANTNMNDLFTLKMRGLATIGNVNELNRTLASMGLPTIVVYDLTYDDLIPTGATTVKYSFNSEYQITQSIYTHMLIPDGKAVMVGRRLDRCPIGKYVVTRNATNEYGKPGFYTKVVDSKDTGKPVPRTIQIHDGMNAAPILEYASAFVIINC